MSRTPILNLTRLYLDRLPGIETLFSVPAQPGVNLIVGPNESGKSSLVRGVFQLLWPDRQAPTPMRVRGEFTTAAGALLAQRDDHEPVNWTRDSEPTSAPDLPGGHVARCYHLGLLDVNRREAGDLDEQLAREIRRQMAGGFDLAQVRELFPDQGTTVSRRQREWKDARQELHQCQNNQRQLAAQQSGLAEQEAAQARALRAGQRLDQLKAAQEHLELIVRQSELRARLAELPSNLENVRAGDDDTLTDLQDRIAKKTHQVHELQTEIGQRAELLAKLVITGDLVELAQVVKQAETLATRVEESARTLAAAVAAVADAQADLDPALAAEEIPAGSTDAFHRLAGVHRDLVARQVRIEHLDRLLDLELLRDVSAATASPAATTEAREILVSNRLGRPGPALLLIGGLALLGAGTLFAVNANRSIVGPVALALLGCGNLTLWLRNRRAHQQACRRLETLSREGGHPLPAEWTGSEALSALMDQDRQAGVDVATQQTRADLREELQRRREAAQEAWDTVARQRRDLLRELGQSEHRDDPGLLQNLDQVARCRTVENQHAADLGAHQHNQAALTEVLDDGQSRLAAMSLDTDATVVALVAGLQKLNERLTKTAGLEEAQTRDQVSLRQAENELITATDSREGLLQRLALLEAAAGAATQTVPLDEVTLRVAALPEYADLMQELKSVDRDLTRVGGQIDGGDDLPAAAEILALSAAELNQRLDQERALAAEATELTAEIARVKERLDAARRADVWEQARARETEKAADLTDLLEQQRDGVLGRLLLGTIEKRHEIDTQPPLLEEMNRHLKLFTGGRYRLRVTNAHAGARNHAQRFVAVDNTDRTLELTELSDGTRAQLLLAARLAFLTGTEGEVQPPLFLDETLTASDPKRFDAIAGALGKLSAATGRQIFYLTSNPADRDAWQRALAQRSLPAAHVIDLAECRGLAAGATAEDLALPDLPEVPRPQGETAAAYGTRLKVPALRPWAHENDVHLFYLWKDDLELVYRLLVGGLPTLGQWRLLGPNLVRSGLFDTDTAARIDARGQVYGAFLDGWRIGRGRPVAPEDLVASEALSPAMLPPALALLTKVGGQSSAFMTGIHGGQVKRLQQAKKEALQDYLERHGHLDKRAVWQPDQIVAHVLGAVSDPLAAGALSPESVRSLVFDLSRIADQANAPATSRSDESYPTT